MKHRNLFSLLLALCFSPILIAQNFTFEKIPDWVKPVDIPEKNNTSKYDILLGYYEVLADFQMNLEKNEEFNRQVISVVSYGGITAASQISITYDTSYQHLKIHHLFIWRKGNKIDRTSALSLEIMNNEQKLEQGIYMGRITAYDILDDVRKDDLIEFAYTIEGNNPIFDNEKYLFIPIVSMNQIDRYSYRFLFSKDKNYTYKCVGCDSLMTSSQQNKYRVVEIKKENMSAINLEENIPTWSIPYNYFTLSSFNSWKDVNTWAQSVFALQTKPNLDEVFAEIFTGNETTEEKINKIINYVQDDIRYMGIESGIGSIKPFSPEQVVKKRFGDCKDKSLLMVSLLKQIGVQEAYPAIVNTTLKNEVQNQYPSNQIFNHCIVTFNYENQSYWVDPTITSQGGNFKNIFCGNFEKALIVGVPEVALSDMPEPKTIDTAIIVDELTVKSFTEPASLKIISSRSGVEADSRRAMLEFFTANNFSDQVTEELKKVYTNAIKTEDLILNDDLEKNIFTITYNYKVDGFWLDGDNNNNEASKGLWIFRFEPATIYQFFNMFPCTDRKSDFELPFPMNINYRVIFNFPKELMIHDSYYKNVNEAFFFEEKVEQTSNKSFQVDYSFGTKTKSVSADDYKKLCKQKEVITNALPIVIYFNK